MNTVKNTENTVKDTVKNHVIQFDERLNWLHPAKNKWSHFLLYLGDYLHAKNLQYQLISSKDIYDQKILQSDWMRSKSGQTQPKKVSLFGATSP